MASDWPQLQYGPGHAGYSPDQPKPPYRLLWHRDLGEPMATASQVIVASGKVFVGTNYGNLYALDRSTGDTVWTYKTGGPILGTPAYHEGIVYVDSMDHCCHAVDAVTGKEVWKFRTGAGIWAAPVIADGNVFVAGRDESVYALDCANGDELWKASVGRPVMNTPAYSNGTLYVGGGDMYVYAFSGADGKELWRSEKIPGAAMREYWLVASADSVVLTSQLVFVCHQTQGLIQQSVLNPYNERHKDDSVLKDH
jgi:outer membrane protein assembly factor BamB